MSAADLFRQTYSREPDGVFSAPGRVNLIGEHTDYTGGLVLPFAIDARANLAAAPQRRRRRPGRLGAATRGGHHRCPGGSRPGFRGREVLGGLPARRHLGAAQRRAIAIGGFDLALDSQVPSGAGLSSSAAVECVDHAGGVQHCPGSNSTPWRSPGSPNRPRTTSSACPCGPMDQTASAAARTGSVLLFDTRAGHRREHPVRPGGARAAVLVIDTRVAHSLADGEYGRRRASCEQAAGILGVASLRDITDRRPAGRAGQARRRRAAPPGPARGHRERPGGPDGRACCGPATSPGIGDLLTASHRSLRDDYEVSCAELDLAVDIRTGRRCARRADDRRRVRRIVDRAGPE